ncbi:hypothetical protein PAMA_007274 [Pampus argenteus]
MVKCVVSGCPNRLTSLNVNRGVFNRPPKRFFKFPKDPARVKVWLAALRETDKQDSTEQHVICEDHFLPEDVSTNGVTSDAIPIMSPYLDGPRGMISPWGAELSEEEDQWATGRVDEEEDEAAEPPQQDPGGSLQRPSGPKTTSVSLHQKKETQTNRFSRQDVSLGLLTRRFLRLLVAAPDGSVDLKQVATNLHICKRRVYDVTNVLNGINLIEKQSANRVKWIGQSPISSFLWKNQQKLQRELENLKLVEDTLDGLIKSCAHQLFDMTDNTENSASAYVTHEDIRRIGAFEEQTVIVVKAPEETKLEVPPPKEDSIQVHLKGGEGPIMVLTCDIVSGETSGCFSTLEESRIKVAALRTEPSNPQSTVQSA